MSDQTTDRRERSQSVAESEPLLSVRGLERHYPVTAGWLRREQGAIRAVDGIDLDVYAGEAVGLIGESGCGKSTAAACLLALEEPTAGEVTFDGQRVTGREDLTAFRRRTAMVFQDPTESLDPRMTVGESAAEPLDVASVPPEPRRERVAELFERVGLSPESTERYPHELSGGQKQRVGLARALALDPEFVVLDEPVSALDASVQAEILALLDDLQSALDLSVVLISHDVSVVRSVCDRVAVMYAGEIVERGPTTAVLDDPQHPYTDALAGAVPTPDPRAGPPTATLSGDVPDPADPPAGCRFHPRCPEVIPPEDTTVSSDTYAALLAFRTALENDAVDPAGLRDLAAARVTADSAGGPTDSAGGPADSAGGPTDSTGGGDAETAGSSVDTEADGGSVSESVLRETLRAEYDLPERGAVTDESVAEALQSAVELALEGASDEAHDRLDAFTSVCERESPAAHEVGDERTAACHLHQQ